MKHRRVGVALCVTLAVLLLSVDARRSYSSTPKATSGIPPVPKDRFGQQVYPSRSFSPTEEPADLYRDFDDRPRGSRKKATRGREQAYYDDDNGLESDVVEAFTASTSGKITVAVASAVAMACIAHFIQLMILSRSLSAILILTGSVTALAVFMTGDYAEFAKSLGVFSILLIQRTSMHKFVPKFVSQAKAFLMLAERRPYPPNDNPWRYSRNDELYDPSVPEFGMTNTLISLVLTGAVLGWSIAKPIPLFPTWIGVLLGATFLGYGGTLLDGRGDMLRFLGHSFTNAFSAVTTLAEEVYLKENTRIILSQALFFLRDIDERFQVVKRLQLLIAELIVKITAIVYSIRGEASGAANTAPRSRYGSGQYDAPYAGMDDYDDGRPPRRR